MIDICFVIWTLITIIFISFILFPDK